jgi:glycosyltransferase involved in cell wall biosynthesis
MDTVEDKVSGLLCPFGNTDAMAAAVRTLLSDDATRQSIVDGALERVQTHFDRRQMGARLGDLYRELSDTRA